MDILCNIRLLVPQTHRPNKPLVLDRPTSEVVPNKSRFGNHPLPRLLRSFLSRIDNLEHLLLTDTLDLRQRHSKLSRLLIPLILDGAGQGLGVGGLGPIKQILGQRSLGWLIGSGRLDVLLFLLLDALTHLDLLLMALLLVQLGPQAAQVLRILGLLVRFTGLALADTLIVIEPLTVLLLPAFDIPNPSSAYFVRGFDISIPRRWKNSSGRGPALGRGWGRRTRSEAAHGTIS